MPIDPGKNLATVHCFLEDKQGYFWLPTNKGLYRVAKKELDSYASGSKENVFYYYFDKSSGFTTNEFNGGCTPCGIVTRDGHFSLPSLDGLVQFSPDSILIEPPNHAVFIDRIITDDKMESPGEHFRQRQDSGPLVFVIASPYFGNPANLHLEYSIPQLDNKWRPVNNDGKLVLTGLHKGNYKLTIRKQEWYGRYSYKTVQWTILPYWYETIWFWLLVALAAIGILSFIFWLRYAREVKRAELLEQKVTERTQALSASNRVKEKMIAVILHDLRSPLRFLHIMAIHVYENYKKVSRPEMGAMLLKFRNATNDLNEFTQDFLIWTNAQKEGFVVRQETIVLREIVGGILSLYEPAADTRNNTMLNLVPPAITLVSDPNILKLIIRNLADNANKYTVNGEIKMEAMQEASTVRIIISDTGKSMGKELVTEILNNTYQAADNSHGFGYKIILELLAKIQGELAIDHVGETGNRITLTFR
jgi:signal transduction histidine kinase